MNPFNLVNRIMLNDIRVFRSSVGILQAELEGKRYSRVKLVRAFPYTMPDRFISVRTEAGVELAMIQDVNLLDDDSIRVVLEELHRAYMVPVVSQILSIKKRRTGWHLQVDTDYGPTTLVMDNLHENIRLVTDNCWIVTDNEGRRFKMSGPERMDTTSRELWKKMI